MVMTAPLAVQAMLVSVQPASGVSTTSLVPNWAAVNVNGALAVGLAAAVSRVKVAGRPAPGAGEVEDRGAAHALLLDVERRVLAVRERAGRGVTGVDGGPNGGVARIEAGGGALGEGAADAGADGDDRAVGGARDVRQRPAAGSGVSWTSLVPNWAAAKVNGALAVGLDTAVSRVKGARPAPLTA